MLRQTSVTDVCDQHNFALLTRIISLDFIYEIPKFAFRVQERDRIATLPISTNTGRHKKGRIRQLRLVWHGSVGQFRQRNIAVEHQDSAEALSSSATRVLPVYLLIGSKIVTVKPVYNDHLMWYFSAKGHLDELQKAEIVGKSKLVPSGFIKTLYWINHR